MPEQNWYDMTDTKVPNEGIMKKIKALLDKANSTDSLPEKEAFMIGAQKLLREYNLEVHQLVRDGDSLITEDEIVLHEDWEQRLMWTICSNNFCKGIFLESKGAMSIIGKPGNISVVIYLYKFFSTSLIELSMKAYNNYYAVKISKFITDKAKRRKSKYDLTLEQFIASIAGKQNEFIEDYMMGGYEGIKAKMREDKEREMNSNTNFSALIRINDSDVEDYTKKHYPHLGTAHGVSVNRNGGGYGCGYADGKGISVGNQRVTSGSRMIGN